MTVGTVNGTAGINSGGNNVTLTTTGSLTIGAGTNQSITAVGAHRRSELRRRVGGGDDLGHQRRQTRQGEAAGHGHLLSLSNTNTAGTFAANTTGAVTFKTVRPP